jgi:hypothetical protein
MFRTPLVFAGLALATAAFGNNNTIAGRPGFFEPTPDGNTSLTKLGPLPPPPNLEVDAPAAIPVTPPANPSAATRARDEAVRRAEAAMDRAEQEHEKLTERSQQSATTLQGAFTGLTGETNR